MSRSRRWLCNVISILGLGLYLWGFQGQLQKSALPKDFPRQQLYYPVRFEGILAGGPEEVRFLAEGWRQGRQVHVVEADGTAHAVVLVRPDSTTYLAISLASALLFWAVAAFVFAPRAGKAGVATFYGICWLYGLGIMSGGVFFTRHPLGTRAVLDLIQLGCLAFVPPLFVRMAMTFPRRSVLVERFRWLLPGLWLVATVLLVWQGWSFLRYFRAPTPAAAAALAAPQQVADTLLVAQVALGCLILYWSYRRLDLTREKKQVKWLVVGFTLGAAPYVFLRTLPGLLGFPPLVPAYVDRLLEMAIPLGFVFAVVRHRFLDIDIIIRRSLIYGILAGCLVFLILVPGILLDRRPAAGGGFWTWFLVAAGLVAGLLFNPLRLVLGRWVDRTFFKLEHDLTRAARELERDLRTATGQADLACRLAIHLDRDLRPRRHGVLIREGDRLHLAGNLPVTDAAAWLQEATGCTPGASLLAAPRSTSLPEIESPDFPAVLQQAGVVLAATIRGDDGPAGLILLGPRETERFYIEADVDHLVRCATTAAENLERLHLVQTVAEEAMARHRLDELNRLKNEFFSRVAHDLRTPLASISWSVQNLRDGLAGELSAPQRDYVSSMDAAAAHLNRLVGNLLEISRLERADYRIETEPLHLPGVLEEAVRALEPLAATRSVRFVVHGAAGSCPVVGNAERLGEVVVNLLENALRFSPDASAVEIVLQEPADGHLAFSVRDHGPGLGGLDPTQLFTRFGQGLPSPYSQEHGFGLGLHIAKSHVELMGGSVEAADHPAGGAVFTVRLALSPDPEAQA